MDVWQAIYQERCLFTCNIAEIEALSKAIDPAQPKQNHELYMYVPQTVQHETLTSKNITSNIQRTLNIDEHGQLGISALWDCFGLEIIILCAFAWQSAQYVIIHKIEVCSTRWKIRFIFDWNKSIRSRNRSLLILISCKNALFSFHRRLASMGCAVQYSKKLLGCDNNTIQILLHTAELVVWLAFYLCGGLLDLTRLSIGRCWLAFT